MAREKKWTRGPWHWEVEDCSAAMLFGPKRKLDHVMWVSPCESCRNAMDISDSPFGHCTMPTLENARLIRAAPDLVEALETLFDAANHFHVGDQWFSQDHWDELKAAEQAIDKAYGDE